MGRFFFFFYMELLLLETLHPFLNRPLHKHKRTIYSTFCYLYLSASCLVKNPNAGKTSLLLIAFALYLQAITCWSFIFLTDRSNRAVQKTRETTVSIVLCFFVQQARTQSHTRTRTLDQQHPNKTERRALKKIIHKLDLTLQSCIKDIIQTIVFTFDTFGGHGYTKCSCVKQANTVSKHLIHLISIVCEKSDTVRF